jgi:NIMA (never in mitosis gene a)-related kinase
LDYIFTYDTYPHHENYQIIEVLGNGTFGTVFKIYDIDDNRYYAIKRINITQFNEHNIHIIKKEAELLSKINSEYVIKYYKSFIEDNCLHIVMEYCPEGDLRNFIQKYKNKNQLISRDLIIIFIQCISEGLKEIHKNKIIHRDVKPENLFLTEDLRIKIGDLGISKQIIDKKGFTNTYAGNPLYMAPEINKGIMYDNKVDIYSFGLIIYELCTLEFVAFKRHIISLERYGNKM